MASPRLPVLTQIQGQKPRPTNPLVDWLMSLIGTGWGEGVKTTGVRPDYGLSTVTGILPLQGSAYEPTLAPGQWQQMSPVQKQVRTLGQLGNIILSGPGIAEVLPRNVMPVASGSKTRAAMGWGRPPGSRPAPLQDVMANVQAPPFYSQARKVVEDPKTQGTQTGEAWERFLTDPKRGVKAEEMVGS